MSIIELRCTYYENLNKYVKTWNTEMKDMWLDEPEKYKDVSLKGHHFLYRILIIYLLIIMLTLPSRAIRQFFDVTFIL